MWCSVTAGLAESNGSLAPNPTLVTEYGTQSPTVRWSRTLVRISNPWLISSADRILDAGKKVACGLVTFPQSPPTSALMTSLSSGCRYRFLSGLVEPHIRWRRTQAKCGGKEKRRMSSRALMTCGVASSCGADSWLWFMSEWVTCTCLDDRCILKTATAPRPPPTFCHFFRCVYQNLITSKLGQV